MIEPNVPLSVGDTLPVMDVPIEEDAPSDVVELDDGSVEVTLGGPTEEDGVDMASIPHDANLIDYISDQDLAKLSSDLLADFDADRRSRSDWEKTYIAGLDLMGLKIEDRTEPWVGACGVFHPILTEAVIRFQSETIMETVPAAGPAKTKIVGKATPEKIKMAKRIENEINHVVMDKMDGYRDEKERQLFSLAMAGSVFTKVYDDAVSGDPVAAFVPAEDLVVAFGTVSLKTCPRITHIIWSFPHEVMELQKAGAYRDDIDLPTPTPEISKIKEKYNKLNGERPTVENDDRHMILEMHVRLDLEDFGDGDGLPLPYVVTLDKQSGIILAIRKNWKESDPLKRPRKYFAHYRYLPGTGFYGLGLIHILGGIAKAVTSIIRQLVDAGTLSNLPAGFKARGLRTKNDDNTFSPGEFKDVDVAAGTLKDALVFAPTKEPSTVLLELLNVLVEEGRRVGSVIELDISSVGSEAPVGTTLAIIERSMKVMSAVQSRVHMSMGEELKMIAELISEMDPAYEYDVSEDDGTSYNRSEDFANSGVSIIPVSDPNATTMAQKIMQYQAALELADKAPELYDKSIIHRQMLEVLGIPNADQIIKSTAAPPSMDPITENMAILNGQPCQVYPDQDHDSHLKVHGSFMQDAKFQQFISQSPQGQMIFAAMQAHMTEHLAYSYRREMEQTIGASLPDQKDKLPPDVENDLAKLAALAAPKLMQTHAQQQQMEKAMAAAQDPLMLIQMAELAIKNRKVDVDEIKAVGDTYAKAVDAEVKKLKTNHEIDMGAAAAFNELNNTAVVEKPINGLDGSIPGKASGAPGAPSGGSGQRPSN